MTTITTPAELDALPVGVVVFDGSGWDVAWVKGDSEWYSTHPHDPVSTPVLPATVLRLPDHAHGDDAVSLPDLAPAPVVSQQATVEQAVTGRQVYEEHGWGGCEGAAWDRLAPATRDGWEFAAGLLSPRTITPEQREAVSASDLIAGHLTIWREHHRPEGITLAESKADWLYLLEGDPLMVDGSNWGDFTGAAPEAVAEFRSWLEDVSR